MEYMAGKMDDLITAGIEMKNDMDENFPKEQERLKVLMRKEGAYGPFGGFKAMRIKGILIRATEAMESKDDKKMYKTYLLMKRTL